MPKLWLYLLLAAIAGAYLLAPVGLLRGATGSVSQYLCSKTFLAGLAPDEIYRETLRPLPGMWLASWATRFEIDRDKQEVRARLPGLSESHSVFREGRGCTLAYPGHARPAPIEVRSIDAARLPSIAGPEAVQPRIDALRQTIDEAFAELSNGVLRWTKAVVIVHGGRVIGERYSAGYGVETPMLSHSIAKSVTNALIGILVRQGRLNMTDPAPIPAWRQPGDPRGAITIETLMRMSAGFGFDEGGFPSLASHMWYNEPDTAGFASKASLKSPTGSAWAYSSLSYTMLSRIIGDTVGGGPQGVADFARRELFGPLGMTRVTLEFDAAGTMMGGHSIYATARDWARLGLLYLGDGKVDGVRLLPQGWVANSTRPTLTTGYGAGFWLNTTTTAPIPTWGQLWGLPHAPKDAFMARGYLGQYVVVVPSENLVVVRLGLSHGNNAEIESVGRLVRGAIDAVHLAR